MTFTLDCDVAVFGAGSAGCCAALAAARAGARTVLVERLPFPGGTSTAVLDTFYAFFTAGERPRKVVAGLPDLPVRALEARGAVRRRPNSFGSGDGFTYDPEQLKVVWAGLLTAAGVDVLLHAVACEAEVDAAQRIASVRVAAKAGLGRVRARAFVDATGDADLVAFAGGAALPAEGAAQPATLTFRMSGVDLDRFAADGRPRLRELLTQGREDGLDLPGEGGSLHASGARDTVLTALTRVPAPDLADPRGPAEVELAGLAQIDDWATFLVRHMPGFEQAALSAIGAMSGIRETRRVAGRAVLRERDVTGGAQFDDQIALCGAPIEDLSHPRTRWQHVGGDGAYGIRWPCLLPAVGGVAVAGRCLSAEHAAHASARSMATCMALGQAAGTAAALAAAAGGDVGDVDAGALRERLRRDGAIVEDER